MKAFYVLDNVIDILIQCGISMNKEHTYKIQLEKGDYNYLLNNLSAYIVLQEDGRIELEYAGYKFSAKETDNIYK